MNEDTTKKRFITAAALTGLVAVQTLVAIIYKLAQKNGKYEFSPASALTMAEFFKIWLSFGLHIRQTGWNTSKEEFLLHAKRAPYFQLLGLALSYFINNHLSFYLFLWADPVSITVMKSGASFITAILSWILLARIISQIQWSAILLQVAGLCLLQYNPCQHSMILAINGYFVMFISVTMASANGIWNERLLKSYNCPLNIQNVILYSGGTVFNFFLFLFTSNESSFFQGYNFPAVVIVFLNAVIGIIITVIYKYTNAIAKTFCSAVATVVLFIINATVFNTPASFNSVLSCLVVFVATYLYTLGAVPLSSDTAQSIAHERLEDEVLADSKWSRSVCLSTWRRIGAFIFTAFTVLAIYMACRFVSSISEESNDTDTVT